jgi:8-oxo-dGTP diphosphatase
MMVVVAAVIERKDRRLLIGQRRKNDTSSLKWEFPGGKVEDGETPEVALAREIREELAATLRKCAEICRVRHQYVDQPVELEIRFYAVELAEANVTPRAFERTLWVLPRELAGYDFLAANTQLVANLATGRIKPREFLENSA